VSLARLNIRWQPPDAARQTLAPVYSRFTEGFETPELRAAQAGRESLHPTAPGSATEPPSGHKQGPTQWRFWMARTTRPPGDVGYTKRRTA
jgi:hypothetical protein